MTNRQPLIVSCFDDRCKEFPSQVALVTYNGSITYSDLLSRVKVLSECLRQVEANIIGISADNSLEMHILMLAVFYSGKTLLPLNPFFPAERTAQMIIDAKPSIILYTSSNVYWEKVRSDFSIESIYYIDVDQPDSLSKIQGSHNETPGDTAYILFTSGSTGKPKGVPVSYNNLEAFLHFFLDRNNYDFSNSDRFLQVYEATFDVFYFSFLVPLLSGATCYAINLHSNRPRYLEIVRCIDEYEITVVSMVPTVLQFIKKYLGNMMFPKLRYSFFSGDALYHSLALKWKATIPNGVIHNFYGPTETTIVCTRFIWSANISEEDLQHDVVALGKPFPDMDYLFVDNNNNTIDSGIGELAFAGNQVVSSYLNGDEPQAFFKRAGLNYYKSGDLASVNRNGNLLFHGRKDFQVKINGFRVETGEIEYHLHQITGDNVLVLYDTDREGIGNLIACLETSAATDFHQLNHQLGKVLPHYMLPAAYYCLPVFPLNANHKIDRNKIIETIKSRV